MKLRKQAVPCWPLKIRTLRLLSTPTKPLTTGWFKCQAVIWPWITIKRGPTSEVSALSTTPSTCSKSWLILLLSQRESCQPTLQNQRTKRPTTFNTTYTSTTPTAKTKSSYSGLPTVSIPSACLATDSRRTLATSMPVCSNNSLWTTLPPRSASS